MLEYRGYAGKVEYIGDAGIFHGEVLGTRDVITFQGRCADEIETAFRESVDDYLAFCEERGEEPDKPYSGKFNVRIPEWLHRAAADFATIENESLNAIVIRSLIELLETETEMRVKVEPQAPRRQPLSRPARRGSRSPDSR